MLQCHWEALGTDQRTAAEPVDPLDVERLVVRLDLPVHGAEVDEAAAGIAAAGGGDGRAQKAQEPRAQRHGEELERRSGGGARPLHTEAVPLHCKAVGRYGD
ncbi:unnamed protein product [Phytophthora fragariaefolia]|uniref:Unnamed protein product n=1 Tax=Phytophthora fragariaefolia TaxID=1490495 RepID=A0A9W6XF13_9STRA|nr:unnamed protein product [Phytophthora fragariaefolia]